MGKRKSIYKSDEARQAMAGWYERYVEKLGVEVSFREVETRFGTTNVLIAGPPDAPPLWCFHGAMANAPVGLSQVPGLLKRFRVHFPDTVGQPGRSDERRLDWQNDDHGRWLLDVLDAMEVDTIDALGVSLGGYVVLRAASLAPERIGRAVLWVPGGVVQARMSDMLGLIGNGLIYALFPTQKRLEAIMAQTFTDFDDDFRGFFADSLRHVNPDRRFPACLEEEALQGWEAPVMLILHEEDRVFPADRLLARAEQLLPGLERVERIPGFKHAPSTDPARLAPVLAQIDEFVSGAPAPSI